MGKSPRESKAASGEAGSAPVADEFSSRRRVWAVVAALLAGAGLAGSVFGAGSVVRNDAHHAREAFERSSTEVASTLELAIHDEESLIVNGSAFIVANPNASNVQFSRWLDSVHAFDRYPELQSTGLAIVVTAAELPAYAARALADPVGPLEPDGSFKVIPAGDRPFYCLASLGRDRNPLGLQPAGIDYCADPTLAKTLTTARDSGKGSYFTIPRQDGVAWLAVQAPVYRGPETPVTVEARREGFVGLFGVFLDPSLVLDRAMRGHPGTAVTLRYHDEFSDTQFVSGAAADGAQSFLVDLHNGWTVETFGAVAADSLWANEHARALLAAGVVLSLLLGVLVMLLASGRARALRLVAERTAELHGAQAQLVDSARQAGMAEIATNVLHNVGNVLNSVNVSANLVSQKVRRSKSAGLSKAVALMNEHADDLGEFLTTDPLGKALPGYLDKLAVRLEVERESIDEELSRLIKGVAEIKEIVSSQQILAGVSSVTEQLKITDLVDDALRIAGLVRHEVTVTREFPDVVQMPLDRHRILLILVNVINNANHAMGHNSDRPRHLLLRVEFEAGRTLSVAVTDNGKGILPEDLTRIFSHGFTKHAAGHGFGLHSSALAAQEIGGTLTAHSDGPGAGATFTLQLPLKTLEAAA